MSPHSPEVACQVQAHSQRLLLPPSAPPSPSPLARGPRPLQLSGEEVTLEPRVPLLEQLGEKQLRGPVATSPPSGWAWVSPCLCVPPTREQGAEGSAHWPRRSWPQAPGLGHLSLWGQQL